jgi:hypothetical protein
VYTLSCSHHAASRIDDKLSLFQHNASLFTEMEETDLSYELETWKVG